MSYNNTQQYTVSPIILKSVNMMKVANVSTKNKVEAKLSVREIFRSTKCPAANCPYGKLSFGKVSFSNGPWSITENNGPAKLRLSQSQFAISPEVMLAK